VQAYGDLSGGAYDAKAMRLVVVGHCIITRLGAMRRIGLLTLLIAMRSIAGQATDVPGLMHGSALGRAVRLWVPPWRRRRGSLGSASRWVRAGAKRWCPTTAAATSTSSRRWSGCRSAPGEARSSRLWASRGRRLLHDQREPTICFVRRRRGAGLGARAECAGVGRARYPCGRIGRRRTTDSICGTERGAELRKISVSTGPVARARCVVALVHEFVVRIRTRIGLDNPAGSPANA
jgi:hypothetical protein